MMSLLAFWGGSMYRYVHTYVCMFKGDYYVTITKVKEESMCVYEDISLRKIFCLWQPLSALHSPLTGLSPPPLVNTVSHH